MLPALHRPPAAALQAGFLLTLSIPDDDRFLDDKLDILELNGLQQTSTFTLFPNKAPSQEMTAFLRLMNLQGEALPCFMSHFITLLYLCVTSLPHTTATKVKLVFVPQATSKNYNATCVLCTNVALSPSRPCPRRSLQLPDITADRQHLHIVGGLQP